MVEKKVRKIVCLIKDFLKSRNIKAAKIVIFGSYGNGTYGKDSDIDIAIVSKDFDGKDIFQKAEMLKGIKWFLVERVSIPVDIIPLSLREWQGSSSLIIEFAREGHVFK